MPTASPSPSPVPTAAPKPLVFQPDSCVSWVVASFGSPWIEKACINISGDRLKVTINGNVSLSTNLTSLGFGTLSAGSDWASLEVINSSWQKTNVHSIKVTGVVPGWSWGQLPHTGTSGGTRAKYDIKTNSFSGSTSFVLTKTVTGWFEATSEEVVFGYGFDTLEGRNSFLDVRQE